MGPPTGHLSVSSPFHSLPFPSIPSPSLPLSLSTRRIEWGVWAALVGRGPRHRGPRHRGPRHPGIWPPRPSLALDGGAGGAPGRPRGPWVAWWARRWVRWAVAAIVAHRAAVARAASSLRVPLHILAFTPDAGQWGIWATLMRVVWASVGRRRRASLSVGGGQRAHTAGWLVRRLLCGVKEGGARLRAHNAQGGGRGAGERGGRAPAFMNAHRRGAGGRRTRGALTCVRGARTEGGGGQENEGGTHLRSGGGGRAPAFTQRHDTTQHATHATRRTEGGGEGGRRRRVGAHARSPLGGCAHCGGAGGCGGAAVAGRATRPARSVHLPIGPSSDRGARGPPRGVPPPRRRHAPQSQRSRTRARDRRGNGGGHTLTSLRCCSRLEHLSLHSRKQIYWQ